MHWKVLPHPAYSPDLVPKCFHLFGPLKETLEGKRFRADDQVKLSVLRCVEKQLQTLLVGYNEGSPSDGDSV
jgi:hypothetical protein